MLMPGHHLKAQDTTRAHLQDLIEQMLSQNPQLQSARFHQQSAETAVPAAGSLPDPVLGFSLMNLPVNSFAFNRVMMTGKKVTLMQHFPFPGELGIKEDIARDKAAIKKEKVSELQNQLIKKLKTDYYALFILIAPSQSSKKAKQ
jgi:outer membrane protein TolC